MIQCWIITPREEMTYKLAVYKKLTAGVLALQRAELQKIRVDIERERLELLREKRQNKSASSSSSSTETATSPSNTPGSPQSNPESRHPSEPTAPASDPPQTAPAAEPAALAAATPPPPSPDTAFPPANAPASEQSDSACSHSSFELRHSPPPTPGVQPPTRPAAAVPPASSTQPGLKPLLIHGMPVLGFDGKQVMTRNGVRIGSSTRRALQPAPGTATQASSRVPMGPPLSKIPPYRSIPPRPAPKP